MGLAGVLAFTALGQLALAFNLPQAVWGLFVGSGFTEPYEGTKTTFLHAYAVLIPLSVFAGSFAAANAARSRRLGGSAAVIGLVITGGAMWLLHYLAYRLWDDANPTLALAFLIVFTPAALFAGYRVFLVKDTIAYADSRRGVPWWVWIVGLLVLWALFMGVFYSMHVAREVRSMHEHQRAVADQEMEAATRSVPAPVVTNDTSGNSE
jgi:hypothetical protein